MRKLLKDATFIFLVMSCIACNETAVSSRDLSSSSYQFEGVSTYLESFDSYYFHYLGENLPISDMQVVMVDSFSVANVIGSCNTGTKKISFLKSYWESANEAQKKLVVYHELAHCYLNRDHDSNTLNGLALSIMYPSAISASSFLTFESQYIEELFTGDSSDLERSISNYGSSVVRVMQSESDTIQFICNHEH